MNALNELLKDIPQDYDEIDVANHLLHWRESSIQELATLRAQVKQLTRRLNWIRENPNDGVALRFALEATDEEIDDMKTESESQ